LSKVLAFLASKNEKRRKENMKKVWITVTLLICAPVETQKQG